MQHTSSYRYIFGFVIAFALLIGISILDYRQHFFLVRDADRVNYTHQVIARLSELAGVEDVADSQIQLAAVTRAPNRIAAARSMIGRVGPLLTDLRTLTFENANQQQRLDRLETLLHSREAQFEAILTETDLTAIEPRVSNEIDMLIRAMQREERQQLGLRTTQSLGSVLRTRQIIVGGNVLGLLIGLGTGISAVAALRARDGALSDLDTLNRQLDTRVQQQTAALNLANTQLEALSHQLLANQEAERCAVAIALHEAIGQEIAVLQLDLQLLNDTSSDPIMHAQLNASMVAIDRLLDQIRSLSFERRPPMLDDFGLLEAIRASVAPHATQAGVDFTIDATTISERPATAVETACFRIAQDASALLLHARGMRAMQMRLSEQADAIELAICGISSERAPLDPTVGANDSTLELLEICERAAAIGGTITINIPTEWGTCIIARFPREPAIAT